MASINKVLILGNLGQDPDVRYTESGAAIATLSNNADILLTAPRIPVFLPSLFWQPLPPTTHR